MEDQGLSARNLVIKLLQVFFYNTNPPPRKARK